MKLSLSVLTSKLPSVGPLGFDPGWKLVFSINIVVAVAVRTRELANLAGHNSFILEPLGIRVLHAAVTGLAISFALE